MFQYWINWLHKENSNNFHADFKAKFDELYEKGNSDSIHQSNIQVVTYVNI